MGAAACRSGDHEAPDAADESPEDSASVHNNRAVEFLRSGVKAEFEGRPDEAARWWRSALESADRAIDVAASGHAPGDPGYDKGWANKAYALWRLGRAEEASAAAAEARRINPSYSFNPSFVEAMDSAGHPIAAPARDTSN